MSWLNVVLQKMFMKLFEVPEEMSKIVFNFDIYFAGNWLSEESATISFLIFRWRIQVLFICWRTTSMTVGVWQFCYIFVFCRLYFMSRYTIKIFVIWFSFLEHSRFTELQGKGKAMPLSPLTAINGFLRPGDYCREPTSAHS